MTTQVRVEVQVDAAELLGMGIARSPRRDGEWGVSLGDYWSTIATTYGRVQL